MKCPKCNSTLPDDSEFCQFCGIRIKKKPIITVTAIPTIPQEKTIPSNHRRIDRTVLVSSMNNETNQNPKKKRTKKEYCMLCGGHIDSNTKKCENCGKQYFKFKPLVFTVILLAILLITSACFNALQYYVVQENNNKIEEMSSTISTQNIKISSLQVTVSSQKSKINSLKTEIDDLEDEKWDILSNLHFYEKHAAIVCDDGTQKYHVYGCKDCNTSYFWIYNTEAAEANGYYACPKCH